MAIQRINLGTAPSGTGGDTNRSAFTKIDGNFADTTNAASRLVGTAAGNVMEVGAFGLGGSNTFNPVNDIKTYQKNTFFAVNGMQNAPCSYGLGYQLNGGDAWQVAVVHDVTNANIWVAHRAASTSDFTFNRILTTANTSIDGNGFIKAASPIVKLFADKIELNDEAQLQQITFEKLGVGDYLIKGSTGFAQEGWYIEMPKDANGNVLVAVTYEQLDNNDISVKTYAKKFDEETGDVVANTAKPRDIPSTRWIDLRLQALPQPDIKPFNNYETAILDA